MDVLELSMRLAKVPCDPLYSRHITPGRQLTARSVPSLKGEASAIANINRAVRTSECTPAPEELMSLYAVDLRSGGLRR